MIKFIELVVDKVFSGITLILLFAAAFLYFIFIFSIAEQDRIDRAEIQQVTEACYAQGMVVVRTDAGEHCADPRTLVKAK